MRDEAGMPKEAKEQEQPRVSVVLATDRIDSYLEPAIRSMLRQSLRDLELLLVVNEKLRARRDEILAMCGGDPRVRMIEAPALGGLGLALNLGVAAARSDLIARMDGDDISLPERLERQVKFLEEHADAMLVGCRMQFIDGEGVVMAWSSPHYTTDGQIRAQLPLRAPLGHPTLVFRRSVLYEVGGYSIGQGAEDWELYLRLAQLPGWKFHSLDEVLFQHRRHGLQATGLDKLKANHLISAGFLFSAFLRTGSPRYVLGVLLRNPHLARLRRSLLRLRGRPH